MIADLEFTAKNASKKSKSVNLSNTQFSHSWNIFLIFEKIFVNIIFIPKKEYLPELDAGFLKWYSKYFGTKVPKPTTPNSKKTVDRALNTYT